MRYDGTGGFRHNLLHRTPGRDDVVKNKDRVIWIGSLVIILSFFLFTVLQYQTKLSNTEQKITSLCNDNTQLLQQHRDDAIQAAELKSEIEKLKLANNDQVTMLELQRKGFTGQLKDIVADLKMHSELIPYKGILGGAMGFYDDNNIYVLTNRWVFACFEDGHISGCMLLRYDINNGSISWKVINSYLDD
ncbi:hypothetical protein [Desulfosporosinus sp. OT]|uniref:hypothetical protein n=1 Tax=Desulfosporosinus sp. OT TaxID=913865 RepID=UPI0011128059|nr:hypothetical protein [Desulfosporosinus sp. OT]